MKFPAKRKIKKHVDKICQSRIKVEKENKVFKKYTIYLPVTFI
jgi:hypothetical protein